MVPFPAVVGVKPVRGPHSIVRMMVDQGGAIQPA